MNFVRSIKNYLVHTKKSTTFEEVGFYIVTGSIINFLTSIIERTKKSIKKVTLYYQNFHKYFYHYLNFVQIISYFIIKYITSKGING